MALKNIILYFPFIRIKRKIILFGLYLFFSHTVPFFHFDLKNNYSDFILYFFSLKSVRIRICLRLWNFLYVFDFQRANLGHHCENGLFTPIVLKDHRKNYEGIIHIEFKSKILSTSHQQLEVLENDLIFYFQSDSTLLFFSL